MIALQSQSMHFAWSPDLGAFSLAALPGGYPRISNATLEICYIQEGRRWISGRDWTATSVNGPSRVESLQGPLQQLSLTGKSLGGQLRFRVDLALADEHPFFLCRVTLENKGLRPIEIERISLLQAGPGSIRLCPDSPGDPAFFANGWQSWSFCGAYTAGEPAHRSLLGLFRAPLLVNPGTPQPIRAGHFGSDFFGVLGDRSQRTALLAGFLSQKQQFGSVEAVLRNRAKPSLSLWANGDRTRLDPGASLETDLAVLSFIDLDKPDPLGPYLDAVARQHQLGPIPTPQSGWCSWYYFYNHVTAEDIRRNLLAITASQDRLPLRLVQLDDGFERMVGDWSESKPVFPGGPVVLAQEIRAAGLTPGVWLAPFLVNPHSHLAHDHPEYLLRSARGTPVIAGATEEYWLNTALDISHPEALAYACQVVSTAAHEWGFPYIKLDFLSAGALAGRRHDPTRSRAQILRAGLEALRQAAGEDAYLLGCGVPLGSAIGLFDAVRIGEDVSPAWEPEVPLLPALFRREAQFPAVRNAIHNTLTRAGLNRRWWINDPDCLLLRPDSRLTLSEVQSLATAISLSGGPLLLSDDLPALPTDRARLAACLLPLIDAPLQTLDWFDAIHPTRLRLDLDGPAGNWHLLAFFNWNARPKDFLLRLADYHLPLPGAYWVRSFWDQETRCIENGEYRVKGLAPHGALLLAVRGFQPTQPQYLGSDLHISQGMEVAGWQVSGKEVRLRLALPRRANGLVELYLPGAFAPGQVTQERAEGSPYQAIRWQPAGADRYRIDVDFDQATSISFSAGSEKN